MMRISDVRRFLADNPRNFNRPRWTLAAFYVWALAFLMILICGQLSFPPFIDPEQHPPYYHEGTIQFQIYFSGMIVLILTWPAMVLLTLLTGILRHRANFAILAALALVPAILYLHFMINYHYGM